MSLRVELERDLERRFREKAMNRFGYSKGAIKKATEVAIERWVKEEQPVKPKRTGKSGVDLLVGLLEGTKHRSSVEEQHEIKKLWIKAAEDK